MWISVPRVRVHTGQLNDTSLVTAQLNEQGIEVEEARWPVPSDTQRIDLVLIDFELLDEWLPYYLGKGIPIINLVKKNLSLEVRRDLFSKGIVDYIQMPLVEAELVNRILAYLHFYSDPERLFRHQPERAVPSANTAYDLIDLTCNYLNNNLSENVKLDDLSRRLGTNRNTLCRRFKNRVGLGIYAWVRTKRLSIARKMLINTDLTVQQICFEVGYSNPANFSTAFKSFYGQSPSELRKSVMNSKELIMKSKVGGFIS